MGLEFNLSVQGMRRTCNDMALAAGVNNPVTRSISGHLTERLQEEYTSVWAPLQKRAIDSAMAMMTGAPVAEHAPVHLPLGTGWRSSGGASR
jgi:hypothetical protein